MGMFVNDKSDYDYTSDYSNRDSYNNKESEIQALHEKIKQLEIENKDLKEKNKKLILKANEALYNLSLREKDIRKRGRWFGISTFTGSYMQCSCCDERHETAEEMDFCPSCGADMRESVKGRKK